MRVLFLILSFAYTTLIFSQDDDSTANLPPRKSKFLTGFYVGPYFANKYSASTYNGYGFDLAGNRNSFLNSLMYQKIKNEYGGGYGQYDQVAEALGVDRGQWEFDESDMPVNMHYRMAILVGFNFKIPFDKKNAIILNFNASKLSIEGNFTMSLLRPPTQPVNPALNNNIKIFTIVGKEQRALFELGYQRIFGSDEKINFFAETGFVGTLTKYDKNIAYINTLQIDLTAYWNQSLYPAPGPARRPIGFGVGAFAGIGANVNVNAKITFQVLYTLSHEKVNIGLSPTLKLQNSLGFRVYYNI